MTMQDKADRMKKDLDQSEAQRSMKKYRVNVYVQSTGSIEIEANSHDEARQKVIAGDYTYEPTVTKYDLEVDSVIEL